MSVVHGATHTQKDDVESDGGPLECIAEIFVPFLCGIQLALRSGVLTVLDLDEVDVTPSFAEVFSLVWFGLQRHSTWNGCSTYENEVNLKTNQKFC